MTEADFKRFQARTHAGAPIGAHGANQKQPTYDLRRHVIYAIEHGTRFRPASPVLTGLKTGLRALDNPERHTPWEDLEQQITVLWLDITHPEAYAMTTAIPLGGLRPSGVGGSLKGQGVKLGYPDLLIDFPSVGKHGLRIEMKKFSKSASPSKEQVPWLERLSQQGYGSYVCKGHAAAIRVIKQYIKVQSTYILPESPDWATVRY